jgi:hypothetical protein
MRAILKASILTIAATTALGAGLAASASGAPSHAARDARIVGDVLVCNTPNHCLTRRFKVTAYDSAGQPVASDVTRSRDNRYRLRVAPGSYQLVAVSSGLTCKASATAVAHRTTHQDITCLVP